MVVHGTGDCLRHRWYRKLSGLSGKAFTILANLFTQNLGKTTPLPLCV